MSRVVVVGSLNVDHVLRVDALPGAGATVLARSYEVALGGKGANQAVAAARQGAEVVMVGCTGADGGAGRLRAALTAEGLDLTHVATSTLPTGRAHITVDTDGANVIVVAPGANSATVWPPGTHQGAAVLLAQLEVPLPVVSAALREARGAGVTTVLNPAPKCELGSDLLALVDFLIPNEVEVEGLPLDGFAGVVIVTLGARGVEVRVPGSSPERLAAFAVDVVDTTAAGDAFCGAFAAALAAGSSTSDAVRRANAAGALACTIAGAMPSLPTAAAVDALLAGGPPPRG